MDCIRKITNLITSGRDSLSGASSDLFGKFEIKLMRFNRELLNSMGATTREGQAPPRETSWGRILSKVSA